MESWIHTWTIIGSLGGLLVALGGLLITLFIMLSKTTQQNREEIRENRRLIDKMLRYITRQEGIREGIEI